MNLDDEVHQQYMEAGEQEGEHEGEVVTPFHSPEGEEGEPHNRSCRQDGSLQNHSAC